MTDHLDLYATVTGSGVGVSLFRDFGNSPLLEKVLEVRRVETQQAVPEFEVRQLSLARPEI